jgi:hypothetical protein
MGRNMAWVEESAACGVPISQTWSWSDQDGCLSNSSTPTSATRGHCTRSDNKKSVRWVDQNAYSGMVLRRIKFFDSSVPVERCILDSTRPHLRTDKG